MVRLGINGFGRIGRQVLKAVREMYPDELEVAAINDLYDTETNAHLFKFDSNYGKYPGEVKAAKDAIIIDGHEVKSFALKDPRQIPWADMGVEIVVESTGIFRTGPTASAHLEAGAKKVIISAPGKEVDLTVVLGVNHNDYRKNEHHIVSNASCTTNCLAPPAYVVHQAFGIVKALMTTVHSYTNDQRILDLPHKDLRRARAAALNIIPTSTGAAKAVGVVIPELAGRFDGCSLRVPTPTVSVVDFTAVLNKKTDTDSLRKELRKAARSSRFKGVMAVDDGHLVSMDLKGDPHSSIVDLEFTQVLEGNLAKVMAWYDNEWGYSCRVADLARFMAQRGL
jgi:glyceraldehyde 3-phosphate dehydrogenase